MNWRVKMKIDQLLVDMIYHAKNLNHQPTKILLGRYVLDELKDQVRSMACMRIENKNHMLFMGIKIEVNEEYKFFIGIA